MSNEHEVLGDEELARLVRLAPGRQDVPEGAMERAEAVLLDRWRARRVSRRRRRWSLALAAGVLAGLGALFFVLREPVSVGTVLARSGVGGDDPPVGDTLRAGRELATAPGSTLALALEAGGELRIAESTRLTLQAVDLVVLTEGKVYFDSGGSSGESAPGLVVATPFGRIRHLGTQFEVSVALGVSGEVASGTMTVRVREGRVAVDLPGGHRIAEAGEGWTAGPEGSARPISVDASAAGWDWTLEASPGIELAGATFDQYLDWLARETGWRVEWGETPRETECRGFSTSPGLRIRARDSLEVVFPACGLRYALDRGVLTIQRAEP